MQRAVLYTLLSVSFYPVAKIQFCILEPKLNFHQEPLKKKKKIKKSSKPEIRFRDIGLQIIQNVVADGSVDL